jgi:hypothetical protein
MRAARKGTMVFFVAADPEPDDQFAITAGERTIMIADADGPHIADHRLEVH